MQPKEPHKHKFEDIKGTKVLLSKNKGASVGYDILKQRKCKECGKVSTYDLERTTVK